MVRQFKRCITLLVGKSIWPLFGPHSRHSRTKFWVKIFFLLFFANWAILMPKMKKKIFFRFLPNGGHPSGGDRIFWVCKKKFSLGIGDPCRGANLLFWLDAASKFGSQPTFMVGRNALGSQPTFLVGRNIIQVANTAKQSANLFIYQSTHIPCFV